jgi:hypothetical protein
METNASPSTEGNTRFALEGLRSQISINKLVHEEGILPPRPITADLRHYWGPAKAARPRTTSDATTEEVRHLKADSESLERALPGMVAS